MESESKKINLQPIIEIAIAAAMVIGTVVPLYVHTDGKMHSALQKIQEDMDKQSERTNKLYEMFIDVVKENNKTKA